MSTWTHVAGVIRFDGIAGLGDKGPDMGDTVSFDDDETAWENCDVPCGSEGSLQYAKWTNPDNSCMARWTVSVFGDLRDYGNEADDTQVIVNYFNRVIKDKMVRSGCFIIRVEYQAEFTYRYDFEEKRFICVEQHNLPVTPLG